jgi:TPR repeat protein
VREDFLTFRSAGVACTALLLLLAWPGPAAAQAQPELTSLREQCRRGDGDACYVAGVAAGQGAGPEAEREASDLFHRGCFLAERPSGAACNRVGEEYAFGFGRPVNRDSALASFLRGCDLRNATACFRVDARAGARIADAQEIPRPLRVAIGDSLTLLACELGSPGGCVNAAFQVERELRETPPHERGTPAYQRSLRWVRDMYRESCGDGQWTACVNIGVNFRDGLSGFPANADSARHYFSLVCYGTSDRTDSTAIGHGMGCEYLGDILIGQARSAADTAAALAFYERGCSLLWGAACARYAVVGFFSRQVPSYRALIRAVVSCHEGSGEACLAAGQLYGEPFFSDVARSEQYYAQSCSLQHAWGCISLASTLAERATELSRGPSRETETAVRRRRYLNDAVKYYRRACDLELGAGCRRLAELVGSELDIAADPQQLYVRACDTGDAAGCWEAMRLARRGNVPVDEGLYRTRACDLDAVYCKQKI